MRHPVPRTRRARLLPLAAVVACLLAAGLPAVSLAEGGDSAGGAIELAPVESVPDAPVAAQAPEGGGSLLPEPAADPAATDPFTGPAAAVDEGAEDLDGTLAELRATREQLDAERTTLQANLLQLEGTRERAEQALDLATERIASRLVELFEAGEDARLQALIAVRDEQDPATRAALVAVLAAPERTLIEASDAAAADAARIGGEADQVRLDVLALGTRIAAIDAALDTRVQTPDERARATGKRYSVDADLVFATGPIPSIGYWGEMGGGSVLDGWMGYAGAAVGGVGCEPPDPSLAATGQIEQGEASWYGPGFHGNATANGETYDQRAMTAAHKTLPFGTIVRVYSSATARCAFVRINDRGPFVDGRIIDLSEAAAEAIGMSGVAPVQIEVWAAPGGAPIA